MSTCSVDIFMRCGLSTIAHIHIHNVIRTKSNFDIFLWYIFILVFDNFKSFSICNHFWKKTDSVSIYAIGSTNVSRISPYSAKITQINLNMEHLIQALKSKRYYYFVHSFCWNENDWSNMLRQKSNFSFIFCNFLVSSTF